MTSNASDGRLVGAGPTAGQRAADRLAFALEEVGFDVGVAFPDLTENGECDGLSPIRIGDVAPVVAVQLAAVLLEAANRGVDTDGCEADPEIGRPAE